MENATTRLRAVRTDVEQAQTELKADQNTDRSAIRTDIGRAAYTHYYICALRLGCLCVDRAAIQSDVHNGLEHLDTAVATLIQSSMNALRNTLNAKLSGCIASSRAQILTCFTSFTSSAGQILTLAERALLSLSVSLSLSENTEDSLKDRMAASEQRQINDHAAQVCILTVYDYVCIYM